MSVPPAKPEYIQRAFIEPLFPALTVGAVSGKFYLSTSYLQEHIECRASCHATTRPKYIV